MKILIQKEILIHYPFENGLVDGRDIVYNPYFPSIDILNQSVAHKEIEIGKSTVIFVIDRNVISYLVRFFNGEWSDEIYLSLLLICYCNDVSIEIITAFSECEGLSQGRDIQYERDCFIKIYNATPLEIIKAIKEKNSKSFQKHIDNKRVYRFSNHKMNLIRTGIWKIYKIGKRGKKHLDALLEFNEWLFSEYRANIVLRRFAEIYFSHNCPSRLKPKKRDSVEQWVENEARDLLMVKEYSKWQIDGKSKNNHFFLVTFDHCMMEIVKSCVYAPDVTNKLEMNKQWLDKYWSKNDVSKILSEQLKMEKRITALKREPMSEDEVIAKLNEIKNAV